MLAGDGPATARQERKIRHANSEIWDKRQGNKAMSIRNLLKSMRAKAGYTVEGFARDARGVAAVEFAFIAPIMILLFVGTIELSAGISTDRKISRVASAIGDLITQSQQLSPSDVGKIMDISSRIMYPYDENLAITITGIQIESGAAKAKWRCTNSGGCVTLNNGSYTVPTKIKKDGTYLVAAKVTASYTPSFGWAHYSEDQGVYFSRESIPMDEEIFLRPRVGSVVELN